MRRRYMALVLAAACIGMLAGCGKGADTPHAQDNGIQLPTGWDAGESGMDADPSGTVGTAVSSEAGESVEGNPAPSAEPDIHETHVPEVTEEPSVAQEDTKLPAVQEILSMTDLEATVALMGTVRSDLIVQWMNPPEDGTEAMIGGNEGVLCHDIWYPVDPDTGDQKEVHVLLSGKDGQLAVSEVYVRYRGWQKDRLDSLAGMTRDELRTWLVSGSKAELLPVLAEYTRHDIIELLGWPEGFVAMESDRSFLGDVWWGTWFETDDEGNRTGERSCFVMLEYDAASGALLSDIRRLPLDTEAEERQPMLPEGVFFEARTYGD